jgi:hypothetical protein
MAKKIPWDSLTHEQRVETLRTRGIDDILTDYQLPDSTEDAFRQELEREIALWNPQNVTKFKKAGNAPTKDVVLGAWRDLERSEAILELIDNSIDVWLKRRAKYPKQTARDLNIYIDVNEDLQQLTYEDNAGGVSIDKLENLVVPGYSETEPFSKTIGSYKTGGKKAIFRLATAVQILTRYWNPAGTSDDAISVQLDQSWIQDPTRYQFLYASLKDKSVIEQGVTRYVLQLRQEPVGGTPWFSEPEPLNKIIHEIRVAYTLMLARNPRIHIYVRNRAQQLPVLDTLYPFSGTQKDSIDIRPQQVVFDTKLSFDGKDDDVEIEVVLGCRVSTAVIDGSTWGIDLYGNDRLFAAFDQNLFASFFPRGNSRSLVRGFVNIRGGNVFVPWDTHKRHINLDRDIIGTVTKHPAIVELFDNWKAAYNAISSSGEVSRLIGNPLPKFIDDDIPDLFIPHRSRIKIDVNRRRGASLPSSVFVPRIRATRRTPDTVPINFKLTMADARAVTSNFGITGDLSARATVGQLSNAIKEDVLKSIKRKRKRK